MNVLLVVWDTCRRDALGPEATPVATDLARRGTVAADAHATGSWTLPSHASLFTGRLPRELGLTQAPGGSPASCREALSAQRERALPAVLRGAGYRTRGTSANIWVAPGTGFEEGFDSFELAETGRGAAMHTPGRRARLRWMAEGVRARADDGAARQRDTVLSWLGEDDAQPFFWFVNLNECHSPYLPPRPWNDLGPVARARAADESRRHLTLTAILRACAGGFDVSDEALERMRHLYARSVAMMDAWLGDVLGALDAAGRLDDTLVLLTSDHGENFGEGGLLAHACSLDERLLHVPFVAAGPGAERFADLRTLADVPRRVAELAGLTEHPYAAHETALAQFDPPGGPDDPRVAELVGAWPEIPAEQALRRIATPLTSVTEGNHKLVLHGGDEQLYDLAADPLELQPAGATSIPADVLARLRAAVSAGAEHAGEAKAAQPSAEELADIEDRMRLLGYL